MGVVAGYVKPVDFESLADAFRAFAFGELGLDLTEVGRGSEPHSHRNFAIEDFDAFVYIIGGDGCLRVLTGDEDAALNEARRLGLEGRGLVEKLRTPPTPQEAAKAVFMLLDDHWTLDGGWTLDSTGGRSCFQLPSGDVYEVYVGDLNREDGKRLEALDDDERKLVEGWNKAGRPEVDWGSSSLVGRRRSPDDYRVLARLLRAFLSVDFDLEPEFVSQEDGPHGFVEFGIQNLGQVYVCNPDSAPFVVTYEEREFIEAIREKGISLDDAWDLIKGGPPSSKTVHAGLDVQVGAIKVACPGVFDVRVRVVEHSALAKIAEAEESCSFITLDGGAVMVASLSPGGGAEWDYAHEGGDDETRRALRGKILACLEADPDVGAVAFYKGGAGSGRFEVTYRGDEGHNVDVY